MKLKFLRKKLEEGIFKIDSKGAKEEEMLIEKSLPPFIRGYENRKGEVMGEATVTMLRCPQMIITFQNLKYLNHVTS